MFDSEVHKLLDSGELTQEQLDKLVEESKKKAKEEADSSKED